MTVKKKFISAAIAAAMLVGAALPTYAKDFPDTAEHWAKTAISRWSDYGVINGDDQGNFRPGDPITRGETATVLNNLIGYTARSGKTFSDVSSNDWFEDAISKLNQANVITGYEDGSIRPRNNVTRQEAAVMIARATGLDTSSADTSLLGSFSDSDLIQSWAKGAVAFMTERKYIQGSDGSFRPTDSITRAEIVTIIDNIVGIYANGGQAQYSGDYGNKLAVVKAKTTFRGVILGGAVISPSATSQIIFNNRSEIDGCLYDLSESASVDITGAEVTTYTAPHKPSGTTGTSNSSSIISGGSGNRYGSSLGGNYGGSSSTSNRTYYVTYDANGGVLDNDRRTYSIGYKSGYRYSSNMPGEPERDGYIFVGWYNSERGANNLDKSALIDEDETVTSDRTLYAGWRVDEKIFGSVKAATGTVNGTSASELMNIKFSVSDNTEYKASGTLYYQADFDFPMIDPSGTFIALTYTLPSDIKKVSEAKLTVTFGSETYTYDSFTAQNLTCTHVFYVPEAMLGTPIVYSIEAAENDPEHKDITVDISALKLAGHKSVSTEAEFKTALADSNSGAITIAAPINLESGTTYTASGSTKKIITADAPLVLPAGSEITIKGLLFRTGKAKAVSALITDNGAKNFIFEDNTVTGAFASVITAGSGTVTISGNTFENTYTVGGGFAGADMTAQKCLTTKAEGNFNISENIFKGYTSALVCNCTGDKMTLTKNVFLANTTDIELAAAELSEITAENLPSIAYNYYDDTPAISGSEIYFSAPVYTDEKCTALSENNFDAWVIAKTDETASLYTLSELESIPFETGKPLTVIIIPTDSRNEAVSVTGGTADGNTTVVSEAGTVLNITVGNSEAKPVIIGIPAEPSEEDTNN